ncbi:MAG: hypothetical protein HYT30_02135 [Parcubacteria group bacterium]|nr:hypothetical protein [Parcubacteria group bacterium]
MHWFRTSVSADKIMDIGKHISQNKRAIDIVSEAAALFGPNNDIPVHTVSRSSDLIVLHAELLDRLSRLGFQPTAPQYIGDRWQPHVTTTMGKEFPPRTRLASKALCLIQALDSEGITRKKVLARFEFQE